MLSGELISVKTSLSQTWCLAEELQSTRDLIISPLSFSVKGEAFICPWLLREAFRTMCILNKKKKKNPNQKEFPQKILFATVPEQDSSETKQCIHAWEKWIMFLGALWRDTLDSTQVRMSYMSRNSLWESYRCPTDTISYLFYILSLPVPMIIFHMYMKLLKNRILF